MMPEPAVAPAAGRFTVAHATAEHWGVAAKACLDGIAAACPDCNIGFLYVSEGFGDDIASVLTFLRETTRIPHWVGAAVPGIRANDTEYREGGAVAVMVGRLPPNSFRCFAGLEASTIRKSNSAWLAGAPASLAIVHGDPRNPAVLPVVADLAADALVQAGGLVSSAGPPSQIADSLVSGGLSGLLLGPEVTVVTALSQGCAPIGPVHKVTEAWQGVLMGLDGRPALEVLKEEAGELIARDLRRASGYIHIALPAAGGDPHDYQVRTLVGIDPRQGWLAVSERLEVGQPLMFVRRDANGARGDLARMLLEIRSKLDGRKARAAFYFSCVERGRHMFGADGAETALVRRAIDKAPLIGFFANGEIAGGRLYGYTGVLAVIAGDAR